MEEVDESFKDAGEKFSFEEMANRILIRGKQYSCSFRSIYSSNNKVEKKVEKLKLESRSHAGIFAQALTLLRRKKKHRGVKLISPGDKDWLALKEVCKDATEFSNEFGIQIKMGYRIYVEIALEMMNGFSLHKFKNLHASIISKYEAIQEIQNDRYPKVTQEAHNLFIRIVSEKIGYAQGYTDNPDKYRYFVQVAKTAKEINIPVETYIRAQFHAFDWRSAIPEPTQLAGQKAKERVMKYCFEHNIQIKKESKKIDFSQIKKAHGKNRHQQSKK